MAPVDHTLNRTPNHSGNHCQSDAAAVARVPMDDELHHLKEMLRHDAAFAEALRCTDTTEEAAQLAWEHGISVSQEALWRNRGTLESGGRPTWRG